MTLYSPASLSSRLHPSPCSRCLRLSSSPLFPGDGPTPNRIMLIGETPGVKDAGRAYFTWAGRDFNDYLLPRILKRERDSVYFTNIAKCNSARTADGKVDPDIADACARHFIPGELSRCQPEVVALMGAAACRVARILNPTTLEPTGQAIDLELHHGFALPVDILGWYGYAIPCFHPSQATHDTGALRYIAEDFECIAKALKYGADSVAPPVDEWAGREDYRELTDDDEADLVEYCLYNAFDLAIDTENTPDGRFWCMTISNRPGTARFIHRDSRRLLHLMAGWLSMPGMYPVWMERGRRIFNSPPLVLYHNAPHDGKILAQETIHPSRYVDTMQSAYHYQYYGQGLKTLAYRLCGMSMTEFGDVVGPVAESLAIDYLVKVSATKWPRPPKSTHPDGSPYKPQSITTRMKALLKGVDGTVRTHKKWMEYPPELRAPVEKEHGLMPEPSIALVDRQTAIRYACRDADATIRIRPVLARLARQVMRSTA